MTTARFPAMIVIAALIVSSAGPAAGAPEKPKEQAKVYEEALRGMMGQPFSKVVSMIADWKFVCLDAWEAKNPTAKDVARHNRNKVKFSKKEIAGIFGPGGTFRVVVFRKLVGTDATSIGMIDESGLSTAKDLTINSRNTLSSGPSSRTTSSTSSKSGRSWINPPSPEGLTSAASRRRARRLG